MRTASICIDICDVYRRLVVCASCPAVIAGVPTDPDGPYSLRFLVNLLAGGFVRSDERPTRSRYVIDLESWSAAI